MIQHLCGTCYCSVDIIPCDWGQCCQQQRRLSSVQIWRKNVCQWSATKRLASRQEASASEGDDESKRFSLRIDTYVSSVRASDSKVATRFCMPVLVTHGMPIVSSLSRVGLNSMPPSCCPLHKLPYSLHNSPTQPLTKCHDYVWLYLSATSS